MAAFGAQPKELKIKEKQDKLLKQQLEKEREHQLMQEIEKTEKERIKKKGRPLWLSSLVIGLKLLKNSGILDAYQCNHDVKA